MILDEVDRGETAPEGWREIHPEDPFNRQNGHFFEAVSFDRSDDEPVRVGFLVRPENCNFFGTCHGGMLCTALDVALGHCVQTASGATHTPTISLTVDFMRAAKLGEWLESRVRVLRITRGLGFCDGVLVGPNGVVAKASGVFKLVRGE